jgi:hypothetical protein
MMWLHQEEITLLGPRESIMATAKILLLVVNRGCCKTRAIAEKGGSGVYLCIAIFLSTRRKRTFSLSSSC